MKTYKLNELLSIAVDSYADGIDCYAEGVDSFIDGIFNASDILAAHGIISIPKGECPIMYLSEILELAEKTSMRFDNEGNIATYNISSMIKEKLSKKK